MGSLWVVCGRSDGQGATKGGQRLEITAFPSEVIIAPFRGIIFTSP